ncbi:hypothetical protein RMONA_01320 [Rickettsia monacensis]|uniref:Uncharacterized protein n=1 Tax=Rickettsia monacensis TaxID=109232 RepID=A0A0B7J319_9RICK|nr:hypothetical protein [Rickettsia monacensis]CEO16684.1 hypothetical protein RMONA_01320 [Rickettsia monacensis]
MDEHTIITDVQGQNNLTIATNTPFVVKNPNWNKANAINIGNLNGSRYNLATDTSVYSPGNEVVDIQPTKNINFSGSNSSYIVSNGSKMKQNL